MWRELGLLDIISHATLVDRAGLGVLEFLLRLPDNSMSGFTSLKLHESVVVMCWYLWWLMRQRVRDEEVPPLRKCKFSIMSIVTNATTELQVITRN
jgi:hypothetical protein